MDPGRTDKRVIFRRRVAVPKASGNGTNREFRDLFPCWAAWRPLTGRRLAEAGGVTDGIEGAIVVRDTPRTRDLTVADRVILDGRDMALESVPIGERSGWLTIKVSRRVAGST
ncbi:head-tail adaptor protein [Methylobacterium nodulans]|uniref:Phage head-tail adaptor n=1 Tax=Methylobacterium nodulans (strain LMG 21967 / CNCM I-2342 / ORS 2060) TaxID=460265 RepID=B8ILT7_METNO|nr:head-tail adaptor protein [Methylobacterium nodulans]ACL62062.1 phage head-tail adaptor [Methylobacterium nodulans ORS 2060]